MASATEQVFVNCPFDEGYKPMFDAIVFAITDLGFIARSAREKDDGGEFRLAKIEGIIQECRYGVHDISAVKLDTKTKLPRFNMPLELGLFLGCKRYGGRKQQHKVSLIFDAKPHRYQIFISDIAGQDIHSHNGKIKTAVQEVRTWLATESKRKQLPGGTDIYERYKRFQRDFPALCEGIKLVPEEVTFTDLRQMIGDWLKLNR